jgi:pSer/pThr/pTyr-binding forkhead associated (FHA) protein
VFSADKSISRQHAEIVVDIASYSLYLVDHASRYGSSVNGNKVLPDIQTMLEHGSVARFGVGSVRLRFVKKQYNLCTTRLDKPEKDRWKRCCKLLSARIVAQPEQATHIVASKAAATVKMLAALVLPLKIVTVDWMSFTERNGPAELIPKEEE